MYRLRSGGIFKERTLKNYGTGIVALLLALVGGGAFAAEAGADPGRSALSQPRTGFHPPMSLADVGGFLLPKCV